MAPPREREAEAAAEAQVREREGEAEAAAAQQEEETSAAAKRARAAEKASELKAVPEGAAAPTEKTPAGGGDTQFQRAWVLEHADALVGYPAHVVAGALYGNDQEYLTVAEVKAACAAWLDREIPTTPDQG